MVDTLRKIYAAKAVRLHEERAREPYGEIRRRALLRTDGRRSFLAALRSSHGLAVVAEVKRSSPSSGILAADADPATVACRYESAGADAVSVLTEHDHFLGELAHLQEVRGATNRPVLRKDFVWTPYQVAQSAAYGADCVLLIVAGVDDPTLDACMREARLYALDVLVEVHNDLELHRALNAGANIVGVNNRDLRTLKVDLSVGERLLPKVPQGVFGLSESGLRDRTDAARMQVAGAQGVLIGEALMRARDSSALIEALRGNLPRCG
jgi:indole-3-glycerol phosphate synthase